MAAKLSFVFLFIGLVIAVNGAAERPEEEDFEREMSEVEQEIEDHERDEKKDPLFSALIRLFASRRRRTNKKKKWKPNGCNVPGGLKAPYQKLFTPSCNAHDRCYYYKQKSRYGCDRKFRSMMIKACKRKYGGWRFVERGLCLGSAEAYYHAARVGGASNYGPNGR